MKLIAAAFGITALLCAQAQAITCPANSSFEFRRPSDNIALACMTGGGSDGSLNITSSVTAGAFFGDGSHLTGITGGGITGSGTTGFVPVFTGATSIGNSILQQSGTDAAFNAAPSTGTYTLVSGGNGGANNAAAINSAAIGGLNNAIATNATEGVIVGGANNTINGDANPTQAGAFAGLGNIVSNIYAVALGGSGNSVLGESAAAIGGEAISVSGYESVAVGGESNVVGSSQAFVGGGFSNQALADQSAILGGNTNVVNGGSVFGLGSTIIGGSGDIVDGALCTAIGGDTIFISSNTSESVTIGGSANNILVPGTLNVIVGGVSNNFPLLTPGDGANYNAIIGGQTNTISNIPNGPGTATDDAVILGGENNTITRSSDSVILGGSNNIVGGYASTVISGVFSSATGDYSYAMGVGAHANAQGSYAFGDSSSAQLLANTTDQMTLRFANGVALQGLYLSTGIVQGTVACDAGTPTLDANATDQHGKYAAGAAATNCTYTFGTAWPLTPECICGSDGGAVWASAVSVTNVTCAGTLLTGQNITFLCMGTPLQL